MIIRIFRIILFILFYPDHPYSRIIRIMSETKCRAVRNE
ncbi:Uncharacterized protein dnl_39640 [Desulfonema limicola]|uniref:Uncharacterized protein n=1 Tax=Desulfonema limicola TaxID=45656 RepID=A0A975BA42_9BACT|nr:Uncharacterized protein dnl_39550 [Desulfonema limicola]QTA81623.1 Uncharacterized protein dnl_39640 [Desulfonema limicola]